MEYGSYDFRIRDRCKCFVMAVLITVGATWLLYKNMLGILLFPIIYFVVRKSYTEEKIKIQKRTLLLQFKDAMQSVSSALLSGLSIENAWKDAEKEMNELHGKDAYITLELKEMNISIAMNQPIEEGLYRFALRSANEDILNFAEVFRIAKRSGGNFGKIIRSTVVRISDKLETEQEIATVISGKVMEQKVMNVIPVALLGYLNITAADFLSPLYGNLFGCCVMTIAFVAYVMTFLWSRKLTEYNG